MQHGIDEVVTFIADTMKNIFKDVDGHGIKNVAYCQLLNESVCERQVISAFSLFSHNVLRNIIFYLIEKKNMYIYFVFKGRQFFSFLCSALQRHCTF